MEKNDKHKVLNSIIMDIEKQKHIIDRTFAFIQSTLISLEAHEKLEGEEKDYLIKDLREKLNEKEKATATLTYLKYKKMRDEMQKLKMHGGPDDYLENLEKIKNKNIPANNIGIQFFNKAIIIIFIVLIIARKFNIMSLIISL